MRSPFPLAPPPGELSAELTEGVRRDGGSQFPASGVGAHHDAPAQAFPPQGEGAPVRTLGRMRSPFLCHCEPVRTPVWQSASSFSSRHRAAKDLAPGAESVYPGAANHPAPRRRDPSSAKPPQDDMRGVSRFRSIKNTPRTFALGVLHSGSGCAVSGEVRLNQ